MSKATDLSKKYRTLLNDSDINTPLRLAMFFAQLDHESGLKPISENLNYSENGLLTTFKKYFTPARAKEYARKPERIANRVYANRMGNGNEQSGDGWKYRGRGFIQLTGKSNYELLSNDTGVCYVFNPDLLLSEDHAMIASVWFWRKNKINSFADKKDVKGATKVINGGTNGLASRQSKYDKYLKEFEVI